MFRGPANRMVVQPDFIGATCEPAARQLTQRSAAVVQAVAWRSLDSYVSLHVSSTTECLPFKGQRALCAGAVSLTLQVTTHHLSSPSSQRLACDAAPPPSSPSSLVQPLTLLFSCSSPPQRARGPRRLPGTSSCTPLDTVTNLFGKAMHEREPPALLLVAATCCRLLLLLLLPNLHLLLALLLAHAAGCWRCCGLLAAATRLCFCVC